MKVLDLFSGIGGFSLGLERAGMETVAFCEFDKKAQLVLKKHWPDVPIFDDVRELTYERILANPRFTLRPGAKFIGKDQDEDQKRDANQLERPSKTSAIDVVCGGFPCQPWSGAGKQRGHQDDRDLWPEMLRVIREVQPRWVIGENVQGFVSKDMGLPRTIANLEGEGYETRTFIIPACGVSAPHQRYRVWVVGHAGLSRQEDHEKQTTGVEQPGEGVADTKGKRMERGRANMEQKPQIPFSQRLSGCDSAGGGGRNGPTQSQLGRVVDGISTGLDGHFDREPDIPRVATGVKGRADRLKQLGNAVVPQIVEVIGRAIMEINKQSQDEYCSYF